MTGTEMILELMNLAKNAEEVVKVGTEAER